MLNEWDGKLTIDEKNGTILSMMVGAGRKEADNSFSGVLMGDIQTNTNNELIDSIGLYGYHKGAQSYGFKVDGTAFIGKSNTGRIEFDGSKGTITSTQYKKDGGGTILDFDDGYLLLEGRNLSENGKRSSVKLSESSPYFEIKDNAENSLIKIADGENGYYLQSSNFNETNNTGTKISINDGNFISYNFNLQAKNNNGGLFIKSSSPYLEIKESNSGNSLLYIGDDDYYLSSNNFSEENKLGTKIDIDDGTITSYDFNLNAIKDNSGIWLNSNGLPYLRIKNKDKTLIEASTNELYLQSNDYTEGQQGIKFDLWNNKLQAYNGFLLQAFGTVGKQQVALTLNSESSVYQMEVTQSSDYSNGTHMGIGGLLVGKSGLSPSACLIEGNSTSFIGYGSIYAANIYATTFHGKATSATTADSAGHATTAETANSLSESLQISGNQVYYGGQATVNWKIDSLQSQINNLRNQIAGLGSIDLSAYVTRSEYASHTHPVYLAELKTGTPG